MKQTITTTLLAIVLSISAFSQINVFPNTTNFELEGLCGTSCSGACNLTGVWRNSDQYGFAQAGTDWLSEDGPTPSSTTGPDIDHTSGTATGKYAYVETSGCNNVTAHLVSDVYDFSALVAPKVTFWYHMLGATMGTMSLDVDSSGLGNWDLDVVPSWTDNVNLWQLKEISLAAYAGKANVRIRIRGNTGTSFTSDMAVDDISVFEPLQNDLAHISVNSGSGCGNSAANSVEIMLVNAGADTINAGTSIPVSFEIGGTVVTDTIITIIPYLPNDTFAYTFVNGFADLSGPGIVTINAWVDWDLAAGNDSSTVNTQGIPIISTFPYFEDFEAGQNGWVINNGTVGTWAFGTPAKATINSAGSGVNSFVTGGLTGFYNDSDNSYIQGPCFDFTNICDPVISMKVWWNAEFSWDGMNVTYSTDGGTTWNLVGAMGDPFNWYNDNTIVGAPGGNQSGWSGRASTTNGSGGWVTARHRIVGTGGNPNVKIRVNFGTDGSVTDDGVAFDDVKIYNGMDLGADQIACSPSIVALDAYEGNTLATYNWSDGSTTATTTAATTDMYVVTMTDGACIVSDSLFVLIADSTSTVDLGNDSIVCNAVLMLDAGNWPQSTFLWSTGSTNSSITADSTTTYTLTVNNICGTFFDSINVIMDMAPAVALGNDFTACDQATLDAGSSAFSYTWSNGDTASMTTVYTSGAYAVDASSTYGCIASDTINVTIATSPVVALGNDSTWCVQAVLDAGNAGSSYLWSTADTTSTTVMTSSGTYTVDVTNVDGCSASDTITVYINQPSTFSQTFSECNGFSISVGASTYNTTGNYFDTLVGSNGCDSIVNTVLTVATPVNVATSLSGFTITATATGVGYQWINCANNGAIAGETNQSFTPLVDGNYAVIITDGPCSDTSTCVTILGLGVSETTADWVQVYPNPATESVNVATGSITTERITLTNALGQTVQMIEPKTAITTINLSELTDGVYFVNVLHNGQVKTYKIMKK